METLPSERIAMNTNYVVFELGPDNSLCEKVIDSRYPDLTIDVRVAVLAYGRGNIGATLALAEHVKGFTTFAEVANFVGYPIYEPTETAPELYLRLK